jgi:hypothetical protein
VLTTRHNFQKSVIFIYELTNYFRCCYKIFVEDVDKFPGITGQRPSSKKTRYQTLPPDIIRQIKSRRMRWARHVARIGDGRNVYGVLVGKPEGKRPLERPRRR